MGDWEDEDFTGDYQRLGRIYDSATGPVDPELIRQAQIGYYACITHLDHQIGRLIQALVEYKLMDNTIILFTSDHGEELCDHHLFRKSRPYEGSCRIPMLLSGPERLIHAAGHRMPQCGGAPDVMPTLLDAAGAPIPETVDGKSMIPNPDGTLPVIRQWLHGEHEAESTPIISLSRNTINTCGTHRPAGSSIFNLDEDRRELHNGIADTQYQERIGLLRGLLIEELKEREEGYSDGQRLITGRETTVLLQSVFGTI